MRGLDTRIELANARVLQIIDPERGNQAVWDAIEEAKWNGVADYKAGNFILPIMFLDEPDLAKLWQEGQCDAALTAEMDDCSDCNNGSGHSCMWHG